MTDRIVVAALAMRDLGGRVLLVRKRGTSKFMQPGGKIEPGESPADCVVREVREELGLELDPALLEPLGDWEAAAANEAGRLVHGYVFTHPFVDGAAVQAEIEELCWLAPADAAGRDDLAPLFQHKVLPLLI